MVRLSRGVWLLAALFFGFAAIAHSQGKWVLWHEKSGAVPSLPTKLHEWSSGESFTTEAACERELRNSLAGVAKSEPMPPPFRSEVTVRGNVVSLTFYRGNDLMSTQSLRMVCLLDTVDPRGPMRETR
jgi:hypothetical protein